MKNLNKIKVITALAAVPLISLFFYPVASSAAGPVINQGTTTAYAVLAGSTITNSGSTTITGTAGSDIGVSPSSAITGFPPGISGTEHSNDASAIAAKTALVTALSDTNAPSATVIPADLNSQVLHAGSYKTGSAFLNSGTVTFDAQNDPNAIFVMQSPSSTLTTSTSSTMVLANGAQACNVFWAIGSSATLGATSTFVGHLYAVASISLGTGATVHGNLLAQTGAVTLLGNTIVNDNCAPAVIATPTPSPTPTPVVTPVAPGTIHVVKTVVNGYGGTATPADFSLSLKHHGVDVLGSPDVGMASPGRTYVLAPGTYVVGEAINPTFPNYISSFSVVGQTSNDIVLTSGADLTVIETNTQLAPLVVATPPPVVAAPPPVPTVTGGKLPKTASPWYNMLLLSVGLVMLGGVVARFGKQLAIRK